MMVQLDLDKLEQQDQAQVAGVTAPEEDDSDMEDIHDAPQLAAMHAGPGSAPQHAQNEALYSEAGQYNPKAAKAAKKKAKKLAARVAASDEAFDPAVLDVEMES